MHSPSGPQFELRSQTSPVQQGRPMRPHARQVPLTHVAISTLHSEFTQHG